MINLFNNARLDHLNTFGFLSEATWFAKINDENELVAILNDSRFSHRPIHILGGGSNVLLSPRIDGLVLQMGLRGIQYIGEKDGHYLIEAQAGEIWHDFVAFCLENHWYGLENLALIPGTVGAAPIQNIGAYGSEVGQNIFSIRAFDRQINQFVKISGAECNFSYRDSCFKQHSGRWIITAVTFTLPKIWTAQLGYSELAREFKEKTATPEAIFSAIIKIRQQKLPDPKQLGNAGSFFKNTIVSAEHAQALKNTYPLLPIYPQINGEYKLAAGWLIEYCGFKGYQQGNVGVYEKQALVLVHFGGGCVNDIFELAEKIISAVQETFNVKLEIEPVLI
jgi:UDP-N-acetylmuramate dehydrogenase